MESNRRSVFFVSDHTAITAETLGHSLLSQFEKLDLELTSLRFVDTPERAARARDQINAAARRDGVRPVVFSTLIDPELRRTLDRSDALMVDFFGSFLHALEKELHLDSAMGTGRFHAVRDEYGYFSRMDAVDFTLRHDDGACTKRYQDADIILLGVSRSGKTPTCLYLSLHFGYRAANFPLTEDHLHMSGLPEALRPHRDKLVGLSIEPERLRQIRQERLPDSRYASLQQCRSEVELTENLYRRFDIPFIRSTRKSIEELAATVIHLAGLPRRGDI